ncbi:sporulation YhaL family protein [Aquibacillus saliphilus]|uniref:sporulation YhaL family protein n=1 Tax=Aquibacillus saliphilus TaxID=1909422 RepID=UPI001CF07BDF|nr:sporulation YhaL family protein [Aquibacillus saliphilus]
MILGIPWWVYMFIIFIFLSGYMSFRALVAEKKLEQQYIEREGKVYMDRIDEKRSVKSDQKSENQMTSS